MIVPVKYLLDTNVLSEVSRPVPNQNTMRWLDETDEEQLYISTISIAEIRRGVMLLQDGPRRERLANWLMQDLPQRFENRLVVVDQVIALHWGDLMARTQKAGIALQPMDAFIAATAIAHGLTLATRNTRDFIRLDVPLFNPWDI